MKKVFRMPFGKFEGEPIERVPPSYLTWMVNKRHWMWERAQEELDRRGTSCNFKVDIRAHSVDRASQRMMHLWMATKQRDEGLWSWLARRAGEASDATPPKDRVGTKEVEYDGVTFVFEFSTAVPTLISVWLAGAKDEL